ncbi:GlsB/YeaQ/YmgE family stress response membrane protein [Limnoglobus roseus]|uniref:GlsB/YeaQ/YmgE family stress response membrane protein n=1 Tax=Limnoglobus roseus TaxID=2598579 RepID=A0A5C1AEI5_9BACT|nr:GlsB/YeaQ/YmgE family stress response membrane protein [Limnoglobus roseus]QEL17681.1 GlsB/YeaQ/YmgE family stress response membrane protein [Limnoglobus roseus]
MLIAEIVLNPGGIIAWVIVGLVAGFLAGRVMKGEGFGLIGDLAMGLIGALVGGFLFGFIVQAEAGLVESTLVAFLGASTLIAIVRYFRGTKPAI